MNKKMDSNRILYLDVLRVVACILVAMVHVSAQHIYDAPAGTFFFGTHAAFDCLGFSGVALYFMISGTLKLDAKKAVTIRSVLKRVLHFYFLFFFWKFIFYLFVGLTSDIPMDAAFWKDTIVNVFSGRGHYHLWFLPTIAVVYLFIPMIKKSVESDKKVCLYYVAIFFAIDVLARTMLMFDNKISELLRGFLTYNDFFLFTGYLGYFVWGHYLHTYGSEISKPVRIVIYILAIAMLPLSGLADTYFSTSKGVFDISMNTPMGLTSFVTVTAIFLFVKNARMPSNKVVCRCLMAGSSMTLGIYLIHPMVIVFTEKIGFNSLLFAPVLSLPVVSIAVAIISAVPVFILMKIPVVRKIVT